MSMNDNKDRPKRIKVTLSLDRDVWVQYQIHCMQKYKGVKHASHAIEEIMKEQMHHGKERAISIVSNAIKSENVDEKPVTTKRKS